MSDEEKYAIDYLKIYIERDVMYENRHYKQIEIILNLIEKQQKEIEELKNGQIDFWISDKEIEERIRNKFVSKDKIKSKIEVLEKLQEEFPNNEEIRIKMIAYKELLEKE